MSVIFKTPLPTPLVPSFKLTLRNGGRILDVQMQNGVPHIYYWSHYGAEEKQFSFQCIRTDSLFDAVEELYYIGTFQTAGGLYSWHLFQEIHENQAPEPTKAVDIVIDPGAAPSEPAAEQPIPEGS